MRQIIRPVKKPIQARVVIPGSKSMTNRALLFAALADGVSEITDMLISDDTLVFVDALRELGLIVQLDKEAHSCIVGGASGRFPKKDATIWCGDSGIAARFLAAVCASSSGKYYFDGSPQLRDRPMEELLKLLRRQGAMFSPEKAIQMPFTVTGADGLAGDEVEIEAAESGQFVSALLIAAPLARKPMVIKAHNLVSSSFVEMTCAMMAEFGVLVRRMHQSLFTVPVPQRYVARDYAIEPDLTTASYFFAAAAVTGGQVTIQPVKANETKQGDIKFLKLLEKMGCDINASHTGLTVKGPSALQGVNIDMRTGSDTFMTLAAMAPFATTPTTITNIEHTRRQESDRIAVMYSELKKLNVKVEEGPDWLKIYPSTPTSGVIDAHRDHRIAMAFSIIGLRVGGIEIDGAECVSKTCPDFFQLWDSLY